MKLERGRVVLMPSAVHNTMTRCSNVETLQHQSMERSYKHRSHYIKAASFFIFLFFFFFYPFSSCCSSSQHVTHNSGYFLTSVFFSSTWLWLLIVFFFVVFFVSVWRSLLEMKRRALNDEGSSWNNILYDVISVHLLLLQGFPDVSAIAEFIYLFSY